ncbi:MAG TPA: hypothetical protein HPP87_03625 [Planctomycetes bacterium]|nr:hypothetical protein [Planctomycetota bacterium]
MAQVPNSMLILLLTPVLTVCVISTPAAIYTLGDLNENYQVNIQDLLILVQQWLDESGCQGHPTDCADLDGQNGVNITDFALLALHWHENLVISELMASNSTTIEDPNDPGKYEDWLEIHNATNQVINMGGMFLVDGRNTWKIPSGITIKPGEYKLFWADSEPEQGRMHTNFQLSKDGDELNLYASDGTTLIDSISFDNQTQDWSLGRYPNGSGKWMIMPGPTPGYANNVGLSEDVKFSRIGGVFTSSFSLELTTESGNANIYYTSDGSEPNYTTSALYTGALSINNCQRVRARAYEPGLLPGRVHSEAYLLLDPDIQTFSSNLPVVIVDSFGYDINSESGWEGHRPIYPLRPVYSIFIDPGADGRAYSTETPDFSGRAGMKVRGNSSQILPKKQYAFETWDESDEDKNVSILNMPAESDWVFHAPYGDKALMRNYLAYKWGGWLGHYTVRTKHVEMFYNWDNNVVSMSDYIGVYVFMEKIKRDKDRVDIAKLESTDNTEPRISGGYIVKHDIPDPDEETSIFYTSLGIELIPVTPEPEDITTPQKNWIRNYLNDFEDALYSEDFEDPQTGYAKYIDINSFRDYTLFTEALKNADSYYASMFMHKDRNGKLNLGPIWDWNVCMGATSDHDCYIPSDWLYEWVGSFWFPRLREDPEYLLLFADRWYSLRREAFQTSRLMSEIDTTAAYLDEAQQRNFTRWPILGQYISELPHLNWPGWSQRNTYAKEVNWMKNWLTDRLNWMDSAVATDYAPEPPLFSHPGGEVSEGFELVINSNGSGTIYYTLDGTDPHERYSAPPIISQSTLVPEDTGKKVLVPTGDIGTTWRSDNGYDDSAWTHGTPTIPDTTGGVGYEIDEGFEGYITYNVENKMYGSGKNTTCYVRIAFTVDALELADYNFMTLKMRFDDGFVAYINGDKVAEAFAPPSPQWNSGSTSSDRESGAFAEYDISDDIVSLDTGDNLLAIHGLNYGTTSSDFLASAELIAGEVAEGTGGGISDSAVEYTGPITLTESVNIKTRRLDGDIWSGLNEAAFDVGPVKENLRITEIMYHPPDPNHEFVELKNIGSEAINLNWVSFSDGIDFTFGSMQLNPCEYTVVAKDPNQFKARYGTGVNIAGTFTGSLDNAGEKIVLIDAIGRTILEFDYSDDWFDITDGDGFSLTVRDPNNADPNDWDDKKTWRPSATVGGSPGWDDTGTIPQLGAIVINEILAHSHAGEPDWIELYNTTGQPINIGGWFLSDSDTDDPNRKKYEIAEGTIIEPNGFVVFYEDRHFGDSNAPGCNEPFALSENGETLYLQSGQNGILTGYYDEEKFDASETNVAFGRYYKAGTDTYNFVAMSENTPGAANAYPKVGPIVISEIMYHPRDPNLGSPYTDDDDFEYVELYNITGSAVTLQEYDNELEIDVGWRFVDEDESIDFVFPLGTTIPAGGYLLLVKDEDAFNYRYTAPPGIQILEWGDGKCNNGGEKINLQMPGDMVQGRRYYIRIDRVNYSDGSHPPGEDPWPLEPDGTGQSLHRIVPANYGNEAANWQAAKPTPAN